MSRIQLALRVADLEGSIAFYTRLFGVEPAKRRPGYANFAIAEPPLKLVLLEGTEETPTRLDHLGIEVEDTDQVANATTRLSDQNLPTAVEQGTTCCYAVQDKVWVTAPGTERWEVYTVLADSQPDLEGQTTTANGCDTSDGCCAPNTQADNVAQAEPAVPASQGCC